MSQPAAITWRNQDQSLTVSLDGLEIATYTYDATDEQRESPRPFFHPLRTTAGETVTVYRPWDHVWHKGIAWSLPHFGDDNFWGGPSYRRGKDYTWLPNNGRMKHERVLDAGTDDAGFHFSHALTWWTQDGRRIVDETRSIRISAGPDHSSWVLVFGTAMTNVSGDDIRIGSPTTEGRENAGYGGLFWRGPREFAGGRIEGPGGATGEALRGTRGPWLAFVGQHDGTCRHSTVLIADDTANAQHPPEWFARSEPFACFGPAPFFNREVTFTASGTMVNRYAVVIADGYSDQERLAHLASLALDAVRQYTVKAGA
ncbi:MAG TPA: PmoA family protein [Arthrobacter sp.]|nr:PmoA family protein [Arthrobacter sp.]